MSRPKGSSRIETGNSSHGVEGKGHFYPKMVMGQDTSIQLLFPKESTVPGTVLALERDFRDELVWYCLYVTID